MYSERVETCGQRLAKALNIRGIKQIELSNRTNIPKSSISLYLKDAYEPKQDRLYEFAKFLNVSEVWLMGYDVPMERSDTQKKNDQLVELITLLRNDNEFLEMAQDLSELTPEQRQNIKPILSALAKQHLID
jgi:transcriptional regulator with XRE-family HTH domain